MNGSITFGIAQSDRQYQAFNGLSNWEGDPQTELRFVFSLHPEVVTLIAADDSGIKSVSDLKGKRVNLGSPGSGHRGNAEAIFASLGIDPKKICMRNRSRSENVPAVFRMISWTHISLR